MTMDGDWNDSPLMLAAAFEGMAENTTRPIEERLELSLTAISHLHAYIKLLENEIEKKRS